MKYDVLATPDLEELCKWVNEKLKQGWQLQGGIATMTHPPRYTVFYQAIVKPTKKNQPRDCGLYFPFNRNLSKGGNYDQL